MPIITYNPWSFLADEFTDGLDYVVANVSFPGSPNYEGVMETVVDYWDTLSPPIGKLGDMALNTSMSDGANNYIDLKIVENLGANAVQQALIESLLHGIMNNSIEGLESYWDAADEQVALSNISNSDKTSLWVALAVARASYTYWNVVVVTPGSWSTYINSNAANNYANICTWVTASFVGVLAGFSAVLKLSVNTVTSGIIINESARIGASVGIGTAIGLTSGKVMVKWAHRPGCSIINCDCK